MTRILNILYIYIYFLKNFTDYSGTRKRISSADFVIVICTWIDLFWDYIHIAKMRIGKGAAVGLQRYITVILDESFMGCYAVLSGKSYGGAGEV
jgi:hypothetical protein